MRRSGRLAGKSEELREKLQLQITDEDGEEEKPEGSSQKRPVDSDDEAYADETDGETHAMEITSSPSSQRASRSQPLSTVRRKVRRLSGASAAAAKPSTSLYRPPLIREELKGIKSVEEWRAFAQSANSQIKRRNRHFRTTFSSEKPPPRVQIKFPWARLSSVASCVMAAEPISLRIEEADLCLAPNQTFKVSDGLLLANIGAASDTFSVRFCSCSVDCNPKHYLIFVASPEAITAFNPMTNESLRLRVQNQGESFSSMSCEGEFLTLTTFSSIYFVSLKLIHESLKNPRSLETSNVRQQTVALETPSWTSKERITCHAWNETGGLLAVGHDSGLLKILNVQLGDEVFRAFVPIRDTIFTLTWQDEWKLFAGGKFSKVFSIDVRLPQEFSVEMSTLGLLPRVKWSKTVNCLLYADVENHGRVLQSSTSQSAGSLINQPLGTFESMVTDFASSRWHSVLATIQSSGSLQFSWLAEGGGGVEYEKRAIQLGMLASPAGPASLMLSTVPSYIPFHSHDSVKLFSNQVAGSSVDWWPSDDSVGRLVVGYGCGLVVVLEAEKYFI